MTTGLILIIMFDLAAAAYTGAWLAPHMLDFAHLLPSDGSTDWRNQRDAESIRPGLTAATGPALSVRAHGVDEVKRNFDRNREVMLVKIGDVVWTVTDVQAYRSMVEAYARVAKLAEVVLHPAAPGHTNPLTPHGGRVAHIDRTATWLPRPRLSQGGRAGLTTAGRSPRSSRPPDAAAYHVVVTHRLVVHNRRKSSTKNGRVRVRYCRRGNHEHLNHPRKENCSCTASPPTPV